MFTEIINNKKISLYSLSKKSGVSYTAINELYRGERTIEDCSLKTAKAIADVLGTDLDTLYKESLKRPEIPSSFNKYFWDSNPKELDLEKNKTYIISRLLNVGGIKTYNFLMSAYTYQDFKHVGETSKMLNPKTALFLLNNFNIKKENMQFYKQKIDWRNPDAFRNNWSEKN